MVVVARPVFTIIITVTNIIIIIIITTTTTTIITITITTNNNMHHNHRHIINDNNNNDDDESNKHDDADDGNNDQNKKRKKKKKKTKKASAHSPKRERMRTPCLLTHGSGSSAATGTCEGKRQETQSESPTDPPSRVLRPCRDAPASIEPSRFTPPAAPIRNRVSEQVRRHLDVRPQADDAGDGAPANGTHRLPLPPLRQGEGAVHAEPRVTTLEEHGVGRLVVADEAQLLGLDDVRERRPSRGEDRRRGIEDGSRRPVDAVAERHLRAALCTARTRNRERDGPRLRDPDSQDKRFLDGLDGSPTNS